MDLTKQTKNCSAKTAEYTWLLRWLQMNKYEKQRVLMNFFGLTKAEAKAELIDCGEWNYWPWIEKSLC